MRYTSKKDSTTRTRSTQSGDQNNQKVSFEQTMAQFNKQRPEVAQQSAESAFTRYGERD